MTLMPLLSDALLLLATLGLTGFCIAVARRRPEAPAPDVTLLRRLDALESRLDGLPPAAQAQQPLDPEVDARLAAAVAEADDRIGRLELLLAGLEDVGFDEPLDGRADGAVGASQPPVFHPIHSMRSAEARP